MWSAGRLSDSLQPRNVSPESNRALKNKSQFRRITRYKWQVKNPTRKLADTARMKDIPQDNWLVSSKSMAGGKKQLIQQHSRLKGTKDRQWPNAMHELWVDIGPFKFPDPIPMCVCVGWGAFPHMAQVILKQQQGIWEFNSVLPLSAWRQPRFTGLRSSLNKTCPTCPNSRRQSQGPGCHLCF